MEQEGPYQKPASGWRMGGDELSEEDVALCEFVCTSKQPLQKILREGLDVMREQG